MISSSLSGIAVPFACGVALAYALPEGRHPDATTTGWSRRCSSARRSSISSVKIVAMVLMEIGAIRRDLGQLILATAILDDTIAWVIIAVIAGIAAHGSGRPHERRREPRAAPRCSSPSASRSAGGWWRG